MDASTAVTRTSGLHAGIVVQRLDRRLKAEYASEDDGNRKPDAMQTYMHK